MSKLRTRFLADRIARFLFAFAALFSVGILLGIFVMLLYNGAKTFESVSPGNFFFSTEWNPSAYGEASFGVLSMVASTLLVTIGAMAIAVPLGIGAAAYLAEVASERVREILKPAIELLAAIPSVAVGFIGIVVVGPFLAKIFNLSNGLNALNGSILLAVMSLPTIITVAEDAIRSVPTSFKEASYALGGNPWTTLVRVTLPAAASGIIAAVILGMGRAIGETMTVLMAAGNATGFPEGFFSPVRTMTATIAIELGEVPFGTPHYYSLFAVGALLFILSLGFNLIAERIAARFRYNH